MSGLAGGWTDVCPLGALFPERGVCALVDGHQVAVFRVGEELFALSNHDPFSGANVISRGIVGSRGDRLKVASPVFKQSFDLRTGECLDDPSVAIRTFPVRDNQGVVQVSGAPLPVPEPASQA